LLSREEGFWSIVLREVRSANRRTRWMLALVVASGLIAVGLQVVFDTFGREGPLALAEVLSVVAGTFGSVLVAVAYLLHKGAQKSVGCRVVGFDFKPEVFHQVLLTLPAIGLVAGVLLGGAVALLVIRAVFHNPVLAFPAAVYLWFTVLAARVVTRTTRFLFAHAREQADQAAEARNQATEAQLSALQARMNPHFLFNSLNTVAALVRESPETAERTVEHLADVLRRTLDRSREPLSTVGDEVEYLEAYLAVEKERWGDRLEVEWRIDPRTRSQPLPPMTLQPLVENALKHGLGARLEGGRLTLGAELSNGHLVLTVSDDGAGFPSRAEEHTGLGNLRRRLATLYGEEASLVIERREPGTRVVVQVPGTARLTPVPTLP
jgi:signal transduction histidine kinase